MKKRSAKIMLIGIFLAVLTKRDPKAQEGSLLRFSIGQKAGVEQPCRTTTPRA